MIDRLRVFMHRPLDDGDRVRLFLAAAAAIALGAGALALIGDPPAHEPATRPAPATREFEPPALSSAPDPAATAPAEEGPPPPELASRAEVEAVKAGARRFLAGYLPYSYRQAPARRIEAVSEHLRRRLGHDAPRAPRVGRRRRPRILLMHADGAGAVRAGIVALIADGVRRYTVRLELERRRSGWTVVDVGS